MGSTEIRGDITLAFYTVLVDSRSLSNVTKAPEIFSSSSSISSHRNNVNKKKPYQYAWQHSKGLHQARREARERQEFAAPPGLY
ncbi:hypothetical protein M8J77_016441 [Diaphorina citri]|nr:hypothetical protein M8J77_016441 [Diaphorina citri]